MSQNNESLNDYSCEEVHGKSSDEMYAQSEKGAPRCHMKPMHIESGDIEYGSENWWECNVCGHTKLISREQRS